MDDVFEQTGSTRLVAGSIWFLVLMLFGGFFGWLWSVLLSRSHGPEGYGIFNLAFSLHTFAWVVFFSGLYQGLMKYGSEFVAKERSKLRLYLATSITYMSFLGMGACALLLSIIFFLADPVTILIVISVALSLLSSSVKDGITAIIGAAQRNNYLSVITSSKLALIFFVGLGFILLGFEKIFSPIVIVLACFGQLLVGVYFLKKYLRSSFWFELVEVAKQKTSFRLFKEIYKFGFVISLGIIAFNVMKSLDVIALKLFFDYADVGIYSVADFYSSILFYMTSFAFPLIPAISEASVNKKQELVGEYMQIALRYSILIGLLLTIILIALAEPLVVDIYGQAFAAAVTPLRILVVGTFMLMLSYNLSSIFVGLGHARASSKFMLIAAVQYILLLFLLIPTLKFVGAALSLTLTGLSSMLLVPYYLKKLTKVNLYEGLWKVGIAAGVTTVFLLIVPKGNFVFAIFDALLAVGIFLFLLYKLGYMTKSDVEMLKTAAGSFRIRRR